MDVFLGEQDSGAGVARAWRGRGAGCRQLLAWGGAGVARAWRGRGAGMPCSPWKLFPGESRKLSEIPAFSGKVSRKWLPFGAVRHTIRAAWLPFRAVRLLCVDVRLPFSGLLGFRLGLFRSHSELFGSRPGPPVRPRKRWGRRLGGGGCPPSLLENLKN
eukprot:gene15642-biopygen2173